MYTFQIPMKYKKLRAHYFAALALHNKLSTTHLTTNTSVGKFSVLTDFPIFRILSDKF